MRFFSPPQQAGEGNEKNQIDYLDKNNRKYTHEGIQSCLRCRHAGSDRRPTLCERRLGSDRGSVFTLVERLAPDEAYDCRP